MSYASNFRLLLDFTKKLSPDAGSSKVTQQFSFAKELADGAGDNEANLAWIDERTLASNTAETLDFNALTGPNGETLNFAEVCALAVWSYSANTTNLTLGNATNPCQLWFGAAAGTEIVKPDSVSSHYSKAGWAVTATSADEFKVANASGAAATYLIGVLGRAS